MTDIFEIADSLVGHDQDPVMGTFHSTILDHEAMRLDLLRQVVQERLAG